MTKIDLNLSWLTSKETQKLLNISGCELMHLRVGGKLIFKKKGNAYYYQLPENHGSINPNESNQNK
jgi:hypothetical protein